jgi:hypothetical protein
MTLRSLFIREHDGSDCKNGMCRHDARCSDAHCCGHPQNGYDDPAPDSWSVILAIAGWVCFVIAVAAAAAAFVAFSDWVPPYWANLVVALS